MKNSQGRSLSPSHSSGSILVVAVWVMVAFSILSVGLYNIVSSRLKLAQTLEGRMAGQYLARAACVYFNAARAKDKPSFDSIQKLEEKQTQILGRGAFIYTLKDEQSKININLATLDIISRLSGLDKELAKKIFESKLKPFRAKEELLLVEDMTEQIFNNFKDIITVNGAGGVNINTAGADTLKVLGLDDSFINLVTGFRAGPDAKEGTADDGVFESTAEIINKLRAFGSMYEVQESTLIQLISQNMLSVSSQSFNLQIETTILEKTAMRYNIVMDKEKIKRWEEF